MPWRPFAKLIAKIQARVSPLAQPGWTKHAVSPALAHRGSKGAHRFTMAGVFRGGPEFEYLQLPPSGRLAIKKKRSRYRYEQKKAKTLSLKLTFCGKFSIFQNNALPFKTIQINRYRGEQP